MRLVLDNILTHVHEATVDEARWLNDHCSMQDERNMFYVNGRGEVKRKDEGAATLRLLNTVTKTFPAGLTRSVVKAGRAAGFEVKVADVREKPCEPDPMANIDWLWDFQDDVVGKCEKRTRGLIKSPTGSGKTEMMVAIVKRLQCRWLLLVDDKDLVHNAARRFEKRTGEKAGIAGDGQWDVDHRFVCATFQTIATRLRDPETRAETIAWLQTIQGVLVDECHATSADTFYQVVTTIPAYYRFGFSGTPLDRSDKMGIFTIGALGDVITEVDTQLLIERKIIARPIITMHKLHQVSAKKTYQGAYSELVAKSVKRNNLIADLVAESPKPVLVFVKTIKHGQDLQKRLKKRKLAAHFIDGKASTQQRDRIVEQLEWGDLDCVVVTKMWQKGKDIPSLQTVINAAGHRSLIPVLQQMGRGMRVVRDEDGNIVKDTVVIHDVFDEGNKWLRRHAMARLRAYKAEGHDVTVREVE